MKFTSEIYWPLGWELIVGEQDNYFDIYLWVPPEILFCHGNKFALFTLEDFDFALWIDFRHSDTLK